MRIEMSIILENLKLWRNIDSYSEFEIAFWSLLNGAQRPFFLLLCVEHSLLDCVVFQATKSTMDLWCGDRID